jgi:hypothetical protein
LERAKFVREIVPYPVVYQITKSVTRLLGTDLMARRAHPVETVRCRLLSVNFFLEASDWPAEFIFDHDEKIAALQKIGCPAEALPQRRGQPYLWEGFVLDLHDESLCLSIVDRVHSSALIQTLGFVKRFSECRRHLRQHLTMVVAVGSDARQRMYSKIAKHPKIQQYLHGVSEAISPYRVSMSVPHIGAITHVSDIHSENSIRGHERQ